MLIQLTPEIAVQVDQISYIKRSRSDYYDHDSTDIAFASGHVRTIPLSIEKVLDIIATYQKIGIMKNDA